MFYAMNNGSFCLFDIEHGKPIYESAQAHMNRIGCMRSKDNLLITGGYDNCVKLYDARNWTLVHSFQSEFVIIFRNSQQIQ